MALPPKVRDWPLEAVEELEERTAILLDSRMSEARARAASEDIVRQRWLKGRPPVYAPKAAMGDW
jgi:hypothetical protein